MVFHFQPQDCPCCRDRMWHCEECWNKYHHGQRDKDFIKKPLNTPLFPKEFTDAFNELEMKNYEKRK